MGVRLTLLALVLSLAAHAAEVKTVSEDKLVLIAGQPDGLPWQLQEPVCVFRTTQRIACGYVDSLNEAAGRIVLTSSSGVSVQPGDRAERVEFTSNVFRSDPTRNLFYITHESNRRWEVGDIGCLARDGRVFACGLVMTTEETSATYQLYEGQAAHPKVGDEVRRTGGQVAVVSATEEEATIERPKSTVWLVGQGVALFREGRGIATGRIQSVSPQGATVRILAYAELAQPGDTVLPIATVAEEPPPAVEIVTAAPPPPPPQTTQREAASVAAGPPPPPVSVAKMLKRPEKKPGSVLLSVGLFSFVKSLRFLRLEKRLDDRLRVGALNYLVGGSVPNGDLKGFGSYVTASYQPFEGWMRGMTFLGGLGVLSLEAVTSINERATSVSLATGVGWRWTWNSGFSAALSANNLFFFGSAPALIPKSLPHLSVELGTHF